MAGNHFGNTVGNVGSDTLRSVNSTGPRNAPARASGQEASVLRQNGGDGKQPTAAGVPPASGPEDLNRTVQQLNELAQTVRREIRFTIDDSTGRTVINVLDAETEELVRQIPSEEVLAVAARLKEEASSVLVDAQA